MPDPGDHRTVHLLIGGEGSVRFGVPLDRIGRVLEHAQLPERYRSVNVPQLFAAAALDPEADRYAEVPDAGRDAHLRLGPAAAVEEIPADSIQTVPRILDRTSARWGWSGLLSARQGPGFVVVVDPARISTIGAPRTREAAS